MIIINCIKNKIKQYIPDFDKVKFLKETYKIYCDVQEAWMNFKLEDVRDVITDELFTMYESQLETLKVKGEQNIMKEFILKNVYLSDVTKQNNTVTITAIYMIDFYDYIINSSTKTVIRGSDNYKMSVNYQMKFRQTLDESKKVTKCPNCGANIDVNANGECSYCHSIFNLEKYDWIITKMEI